MLNAVTLVEKQLEYYNNHDLEGFVSTYSPSIQIFNQGEDTPYIEGHEALRNRYEKRFQDPILHAKIVNRMVIGNRVIDHENVTVSDSESIVNVIAIYEVENQLIQRVWFIR